MVVKYTALTHIVARPIELLDQCSFGLANPVMNDFFTLPVPGTERGRPLEHQVLKEMRSAVLAGGFMERAHIGEDLADDAVVVWPLDNQQAKSVVENVLKDGQVISLRVCRQTKEDNWQNRQGFLGSHASPDRPRRDCGAVFLTSVYRENSRASDQ